MYELRFCDLQCTIKLHIANRKSKIADRKSSTAVAKALAVNGGGERIRTDDPLRARQVL